MRLVAIAVGMLALWGCSEQPQQPSASDRLVAKAHQSVLSQLRDPESARFTDNENLVFPDLGLVCGEVNAKNAFGGYTGAQLYAYSRDTGARLFETNPDAFSEVHDQCLAALREQTKALERKNAERSASAGGGN